MPRPRATPEHRARERQKLREAASVIHREKGLSGITVRSVTSRAGVSPGALYNYFDDLQDLMRSLWVPAVERSDRQLAEIAERIADPVDRLRALLEAYIDFVTEHPDIHRGVFLFVRTATQPEPEQRPLDETPLFVHLYQAIVDGQRDGTIREMDAHLAAQTLWAGIHGAMAMPINAAGIAFDDGDTLGPAMIDILIAALRP